MYLSDLSQLLNLTSNHSTIHFFSFTKILALNNDKQLILKPHIDLGHMYNTTIFAKPNNFSLVKLIYCKNRNAICNFNCQEAPNSQQTPMHMHILDIDNKNILVK